MSVAARHRRWIAFLAVLVVGVGSLVACGQSPAPSGPGTATLDVFGERGECRSFGGCAWVARLTGPAGASEATFQVAFEGPVLALGDGLPAVLQDGEYALAFEQRLMSDAISNIGPRDYSVNASCSVSLTVPGGRSVFHIRVAFELERCSISASREQIE